ncbi:hypothetical protein ACFSUK_05190 [Sphingobium scionense]
MPAQTTPALAHQLQGGRNKRTYGREDENGVELHRWLLGRCAGPAAAERAREPLGLRVSFAGEGIDLAPLPDGDLGDDVGGRAKPDEADAVAVAGKAQRPPSDEARAQ